MWAIIAFSGGYIIIIWHAIKMFKCFTTNQETNVKNIQILSFFPFRCFYCFFNVCKFEKYRIYDVTMSNSNLLRTLEQNTQTQMIHLKYSCSSYFGCEQSYRSNWKKRWRKKNKLILSLHFPLFLLYDYF